MGKEKRTDRYIRFVKKYLKKTGRVRSLEELNKSLKNRELKDERKPVSLSFTILKPPERKKIDIEPAKPDKRRKNEAKENGSKEKVVEVPDDFKKLAKHFGLPEEHLDFFYENRDLFHWESKDKTWIHCSETGCKFTTKVSIGCLVEHMTTFHHYADIPCGKPDCSFIAFSQKNLNLHRAAFHGHGKKPDAYGSHNCPYPTCRASFRYNYALEIHIDTHENRVYSCSYCPYRTTTKPNLGHHLNTHFDIRKHVCNICSSSFILEKNLKEHVLCVHNDDTFECAHCGFSAPKMYLMKRHRINCEERLKHSRIL